jgi:hypothetical protein
MHHTLPTAPAANQAYLGLTFQNAGHPNNRWITVTHRQLQHQPPPAWYAPNAAAVWNAYTIAEFQVSLHDAALASLPRSPRLVGMGEAARWGSYRNNKSNVPRITGVLARQRWWQLTRESQTLGSMSWSYTPGGRALCTWRRALELGLRDLGGLWAPAAQHPAAVSSLTQDLRQPATQPACQSMQESKRQPAVAIRRSMPTAVAWASSNAQQSALLHASQRCLHASWRQPTPNIQHLQAGSARDELMIHCRIKGSHYRQRGPHLCLGSPRRHRAAAAAALPPCCQPSGCCRPAPCRLHRWLPLRHRRQAVMSSARLLAAAPYGAQALCR